MREGRVVIKLPTAESSGAVGRIGSGFVVDVAVE
jgi:hypothetical protein